MVKRNGRYKNGGKLTVLKQAFVREYLVDLNQQEAVKRAGYTCKNNYVASSKAYKLLREPVVAEAIKKEMDERAQRVHLRADEVLNELKKLVLSDIRKYYDKDGNLKNISDLPDDLAGAVAGVEVLKSFLKDEDGNFIPEFTKKIKLWDKNSAIQMALKHLGIQGTDKTESQNTNSNLNLNLTWEDLKNDEARIAAYEAKFGVIPVIED
jgi:phage terminase small subunit